MLPAEESYTNAVFSLDKATETCTLADAEFEERTKARAEETAAVGKI